MKTLALKWILALALVLSFGLEAAAQQGEPPPARVVTVEIQKRLLVPQMQVPGTVVSKNDSRISAEITGRIMAIAEVGDTFIAGDVIARIDDRFYLAQVKRMEADLRQKNQNLSRIEELTSSQFSSVSNLELATADRDIAEATLDQAKYDLERTKIRAPFSGVVVERLSQAGEYATVGTVIVRLVDTHNIEISARVPISSAPYLEDLAEVFVSEGLDGLKLPVRAVVPVGDERSRMMEIRISLSEGNWVVGTAVKVDIPSGPALEVLAVPRDALILRSNNIYLFTVDADNIAKRISIRIGAASGDYVEVIGDVPEGVQVVVRGGERLREGQKVAALGDNL
ncbi:MAG: efflux RND transporter periplasmic adaptor subunit [Alphaproteobacteria bacterium]|nr:MAG: efflux RND transporter periplasmic adaptor subunit [Alphaproteobacteria bacterium]